MDGSALQTARPVAQALGLTVTPAPAFREGNNGERTGMDNGLAAGRSRERTETGRAESRRIPGERDRGP